MCSLVSADPRARGCGVAAMRPLGLTRRDSFSRPLRPPCSAAAARWFTSPDRRRSKVRSRGMQSLRRVDLDAPSVSGRPAAPITNSLIGGGTVSRFCSPVPRVYSITLCYIRFFCRDSSRLLAAGPARRKYFRARSTAWRRGTDRASSHARRQRRESEGRARDHADRRVIDPGKAGKSRLARIGTSKR